MHEPSRRRLLAGVGAGVAGLLAGCGAPSTDEGTPTPSPTATPAIPADAPDFWHWLPTPGALGTDPYSLGALELGPLREASLTQRNLNPARFVPRAVEVSLDSTRELLTLSTPDVGVGVLVGDYDTAPIEEALVEAGLTGTDDGAYSGDTVRVRVAADRLLWADHPERNAETLAALRRRLDGDGDPYPADAPHLTTVLSAISGRPATFATRFSRDDGPFETARFLGTAIGAEGDTVTWRSAIAFEGTPPAAARDSYRSEFEDKQGFSNVQTRTREGLLVLDAETTVAWATSTQPL